MTEPPSCDYYEDMKDCDHPGWSHATCEEDIREAIEKNGHTIDKDGDYVFDVKIRGRESRPTVFYGSRRSTPEDEQGEYYIEFLNDGGLQWGYILVPDRPVTQEELDEVYRILGAKP